MDKEQITRSVIEGDFGNGPTNEKKVMTREQKRNLFFGLMIIVPLVLFTIFYIVVNFNTIILAFKKYEPKDVGVGFNVSFAWFDNFISIIKLIGHGENWKMIKNSVILWACKMGIGIPCSILFSYYVYKKRLASGFFRVILFLPNVISNIIMVSMFRYFVDQAVPAMFPSLFEPGQGLINLNPDAALPTIIFFNLWLGFAEQTLLFTSAMSSINESVVESAQLDGASPMQELWCITLPMIYSTFTTFIIVGLAVLFTDQMSLVTFYDLFQAPEDIRTIGFYLFWQTYESRGEYSPITWAAGGKLTYPELSAFGLMISIIVIPLSLGVKKLLEKVGPSVE